MYLYGQGIYPQGDLPCPFCILSATVLSLVASWNMASPKGQWCAVLLRGMLAVIDNDSISCILHERMRVIDGTADRLRLPSLLRTRRLFSNDAMGTDEGPSSTATRRRPIGDSLKTWATAIKADLEPLFGPGTFGYARQKMDWEKLSSGLTHDSYF